jgi:hypothetical protein
VELVSLRVGGERPTGDSPQRQDLQPGCAERQRIGAGEGLVTTRPYETGRANYPFEPPALPAVGERFGDVRRVCRTRPGLVLCHSVVRHAELAHDSLGDDGIPRVRGRRR